MTRHIQAPAVIETEGNPLGDKTFKHPAFGIVALHSWSASGDGMRLYGSDLRHSTGMTLTLFKSEQVRGLSGNYHAQRERVAEFSMSASQWARLVSSVGRGGGVPVTLENYREGQYFEAPMIGDPPKPRAEVFRDEMADGVRKHLTAMQVHVARLGVMLDSGKLTKTELREVYKELARHCEQLPGSVEFVHEQFERSIEHSLSDAKTELEAHIDGVAKQIGYESLRELAPRLTDAKGE